MAAVVPQRFLVHGVPEAPWAYTAAGLACWQPALLKCWEALLLETCSLQTSVHAGGLVNWRLWYLSAAWFMISCSSMGVLFWVPLLLKSMLAGDFGGHAPTPGGAAPPPAPPPAQPHGVDREEVSWWWLLRWGAGDGRRRGVCLVWRLCLQLGPYGHMGRAATTSQ